MKIYTEKYLLSISKKQKNTLNELKRRKIKVPHFIREAIKEKIKRDAPELVDKSKLIYCPFSNETIVIGKKA
jgi:hypothetical protein